MAPATFQIMSDLHLETHPTYSFEPKQTAPYLALLGDIGHIIQDGLFSFLERQLSRYWVVFFLLGNHEPAHTSWAAARARMRDFESRMNRLHTATTMGKFVVLDQTRYDLNDGLTILGCTLFSQVERGQAAAVAGRLVDFKEITGWSVTDHNDAHNSDLKWLDEQVAEISREEPERQIVIFTHHSPTVDERATNPSHEGSEVSSGFATDLNQHECWSSPKVIMWAFGHTHFNCDFDDLMKRVVTNQKGYHGAPQQSFRQRKTFTVGVVEASNSSTLLQA